ncbi:MAG: hypothetical protein ACKVZ6_19025 [Kineosporiaceae bacterium]|jgi:hypothetical protein
MRVRAHRPRLAGSRLAGSRLAGSRLAGSRPRAGAVVLAGLVVGILGSGAFVWQGTNSAFTASTGNGANSWSSGTVVVSDDDAGSALFSAGPVVPGDTGTRCIAVTYDGSVTATVRLFATSASGGLGPYLDLLVEQGSGAGNAGSASDCTGFSGTTIWSGTLASFGTTTTAFESGVGTFAPTGPGQVQVYRITWTLDPAAGDAIQGTAATVSFVWEARS